MRLQILMALLWAVSRAPRGKIATRVMPKRLNFLLICIVHIIYKSAGHGLETHVLDINLFGIH
jgi:hypothetical protein